MVEASELLEYAETNNIASWNQACEIIEYLYPQDGEGTSYVEVSDMIRNPDLYEEKLCQIVVGFATEHDAKFHTLKGFTFYNG